MVGEGSGRRIACLAVAVTATVAMALTPATAWGIDSLTVSAIQGGNGVSIFDTANGTVTLSGNLSGLTVSASAEGHAGLATDVLTVAPAPGGLLQEGDYDGAASPQFADQPILGLTQSGAGCPGDSYGDFTIRDIGVDPNGNVDRLWLTYVEYCSIGSAPTFGEVRVGEPAAPDGESVEPSEFTWPPSALEQIGHPIDVVAGSGGLHISAVTLLGAGASDFQLADEGCSGAVLAPGERCEVDVAPIESTIAPAAVEIDDGSSAPPEVPIAEDTRSTLVPTEVSVQPEVASAYGQPLDYFVSISSPVGGDMTGTTALSLNGSPWGSPAPVNPTPIYQGEATAIFANVLPFVGSTLTVNYSGDASYAPSSTTAPSGVVPDRTSISLSPSSATLVGGFPFTVTAAVSNIDNASQTPVGSVQFSVDGVPAGAPQPVGSSGLATAALTEPAGTHSVSAQFNPGNVDCAPSQATQSLLVTGAPTPTSQIPSSGTLGSATTVRAGASSRPVAIATSTARARGHDLIVRVDAHAAGTVVAVATIVSGSAKRPRLLSFGSAKRSLARPEVVVLEIRPGRQAAAKLASHTVLHTRIVVTFKARSGTLATSRLSATVHP